MVYRPSRAFSGARFLELRKEAGLKGSDIHRRTGIAQHTLSSWIHGRACPNLVHLVLIADVIGCDINDFFVEVDRVA